MIQEQPYKNDAFHENYVDREEELLHSPWAHHSLSTFPHVDQLGNSPPCPFGFLQRLITSAVLITSLATSDTTQSPAPLPTPEVEEVGWVVGLKIAI